MAFSPDGKLILTHAKASPDAFGGSSSFSGMSRPASRGAASSRCGQAPCCRGPCSVRAGGYLAIVGDDGAVNVWDLADLLDEKQKESLDAVKKFATVSPYKGGVLVAVCREGDG